MKLVKIWNARLMADHIFIDPFLEESQHDHRLLEVD